MTSASQNIRFMNNNFLERSFSYSSQLTTFPASNVIDKSRSKVWNPAGNFEIDATNNLLYINDGSNKTITLTAASYTYSTLAAHIQTQLNASSSNWTCVYDFNGGTFKFTINRTSGTAVLRKSVTTTAVWDTLGYTGTVDVSSAPFVANEQRNHTSEWVKCDTTVAQAVTFVGIIGGIDTIFPLSATATVKLQGNNLDSWSSPAVEVVIPVTSLGVFSFIDGTTTATYRYWRVVIIDRLNTLGPAGVALAYAYAGDDKTITASNIANGFIKTLNDPSIVSVSENGALFFEIKPRYKTITSAQIQLLSGSQLNTIEQLFYDLGVRTPFFVSIDPSVAVSTLLQDLTYFVVMNKPPTLSNVFRNYYNLAFEMREAF